MLIFAIVVPSNDVPEPVPCFRRDNAPRRDGKSQKKHTREVTHGENRQEQKPQDEPQRKRDEEIHPPPEEPARRPKREQECDKKK
jgi:hypothetical protein